MGDLAGKEEDIASCVKIPDMACDSLQYERAEKTELVTNNINGIGTNIRVISRKL